MRINRHNRGGFGRLEVLLVLAFVTLLFQVFPSLWNGLVWSFDLRNWSRGAWMSANVAIVLVLFSIRFGPDLYREWRGRRPRIARKSERHEKQLTLKEERALYERMREARKKQVI
ncbi:MAG: hypothetical protein L0228_02350 [Planctomycetes bacterium]|nr:hypothetical protein [Planctomycetota bacterium]